MESTILDAPAFSAICYLQSIGSHGQLALNTTVYSAMSTQDLEKSSGDTLTERPGASDGDDKRGSEPVPTDSEFYFADLYLLVSYINPASVRNAYWINYR